MPDPASRFVEVDGVRTHYFEAGDGHPVVLLHSGEFGACAELSWEFTIGPLSEHFRVLAPDWLGFGRSEKVFSFENMRAFRIRHIAGLLDALDIDSAHFIGNSMGGGTLAQAALMEPSPFPIAKMVLAGAGGRAPVNDARTLLNTYDGTRDHMQRIVETLVRRPDLRSDPDYIDRRHRLSLEPGTWEATAAARLTMPGRTPGKRKPVPYEDLTVPTLIIAGAHDPLRDPGFGEALHRQIPDSELAVFEQSGHSPQLDEPDLFNETVITFLSRP